MSISEPVRDRPREGGTSCRISHFAIVCRILCGPRRGSPYIFLIGHHQPSPAAHALKSVTAEPVRWPVKVSLPHRSEALLHT